MGGKYAQRRKMAGLRFVEVLVIIKFAESFSKRRRVDGESSRKRDRNPVRTVRDGSLQDSRPD